MSFYWERNGDGQTWSVYLVEVAPTMLASGPKYQTWFIRNLQPDGVCHNCRQRRGWRETDSGVYTCDACQAECDRGLRSYLARL